MTSRVPPSPLRVILTAGGFAEKFGGPSRTIPGLAAGLRASGIDAVLVSGYAPERDGPTFLPPGLEQQIVRVDVRHFGPLRLYPTMSAVITEQASSSSRAPCVIHDNGVWGHYNWAAFNAARRLKAPYLLSPRGMLETWSLRQKRMKKRLAMTLFQRRILNGATVFVATAESEAESVRRLGLKQPIAIVPNGIQLLSNPPFQRRNQNRSRVLLFLSRIHPKKGIPLLLNAWACTRPKGWVLQIAGPDEAGHEAEVRKLVADLNIGDSVILVGPVEGHAKQALLTDADVFILPTYSENFGVVVAEALNAGLPVITTTGAPWADLGRYDCGWWVDISVPAIAQAIQKATNLSDDARRRMGSKAREFAKRFDWAEVSRQMALVYQWTLGLGDCPGSVVFN
jgi:glycosyltransferase involved in cell wall biosynthesis